MPTATSQAGMLLFGPVNTNAMGGAVSKYYAHRALDVDLAVIDDQRLGPPEVGGRPLPTLPYKGGYMVAGGATLNPRLQNSFGWLLYGTLGAMDYQNAGGPFKAINREGLVTETSAANGTLTLTGALPAAGAKLAITIVRPDTVAIGSLSVSVAGTATPAAPEVFAFSTGATGTQRNINNVAGNLETIVGEKVFTTITTITITGGSSNIRIMVGWEDPSTGVNTAMQHDFILSTSDSSMVPWMGFRKYVPPSGASTTALGETYTDCKIIGTTISLPNDGLINARVDVLGRDFKVVNDPWSAPNWGTTQPTFEGYDSVPIGSVTNGYLKIPYFDGVDLPIVGAQVGFVNQPLDQRMERIYGDPMLNDITVVGRQMTVDLTVKWNNADLYRAVLGNSKTATAWNATPFVTRLDLVTVSPSNIVNSTTPYSLRVQAKQVMLAMRGGIQLAAGQAVMMRFTGTALDVGGDYCRMSLVNQVAKYDVATPA